MKIIGVFFLVLLSNVAVAQTDSVPDHIPGWGVTAPEIYDATDVDIPASFPDGPDSLRSFIARNTVYPPAAMELGIQGKCTISFVVRETGHIYNIIVVRGIADCPECDHEAIRVFRSMPDWIPARKNGKAVQSVYRVPIIFKMDTEPVGQKKRRK